MTRIALPFAALSLAALAALTLADPVAAQTAPTPPGFVAPSWTTPPDPELAAELLPPFAAVIGVDGRATVRCLAERDGHSFLCEVVDEYPKGMGFGAAGLLVVASGEVRAARVNGRPVPRWVQTTVRFDAFGLDDPVEAWTGREPTQEALDLARQVVETGPTYRAAALEDMVRGMDADRQPIVLGWIAELLPDHLRTMEDAPVVQTARVFTAAQLRTILAGGTVPLPDPDVYDAALPDLSPADMAAMRELRRRYCQRWSCDAG